MDLETLLEKLETERGWLNTQYLTTMQIELIKDILEIVNSQTEPVTAICEHKNKRYESHFTFEEIYCKDCGAYLGRT